MRLFRLYYICPACFEKHRLHDVEFRCANDSRRCAPEPDKVFASSRGLSGASNLPRIVKAPGSAGVFFKLRMPAEARCDSCGFKTKRRICPTCHSDLPYTIGDYEDLIFGVIGAKESGKSHYISVLINKIRNEIGAAFDCGLQPLNDDTVHRYHQDFYEPVFKKHETIPGTAAAKAGARMRIPLAYSLTFIGRSFLKKKMITHAVTTAFFDTAGEDLNSEDTISTVNKFIYNSSALIVLLDPLQLPQVRSQLPAGVPLPDENTEIQDILARTANLIRKASGIKPHELIDIPVAVAFSKFDAIEPLIDPSSLLIAPSRYGNFYDENEFSAIHTEMEAYVREWSGDSLIQQLRSNFRDYAFFGFTALGCNPDINSKIPKLRPHRVEDPFLWLLWRKGLILTKRQKLLKNIYAGAIALLAVMVAIVLGGAAGGKISSLFQARRFAALATSTSTAQSTSTVQPSTTTSVLPPAPPSTVIATLTTVPVVSTGTLQISCEPPGATWSIGDKKMGLTGEIRDMEASLYQITVSKEGFKDWRGSVGIVANNRTFLPVRLEQISIPPPTIVAPGQEHPVVALVRSYYADDLNSRRVDNAIRKWRAPKVDKLVPMIQRIDWFRVNEIKLSYETSDYAEVYVDVTGKDRVSPKERNWRGTVKLQRIDGEWKIDKMNLSEPG